MYNLVWWCLSPHLFPGQFTQPNHCGVIFAASDLYRFLTDTDWKQFAIRCGQNPDGTPGIACIDWLSSPQRPVELASSHGYIYWPDSHGDCYTIAYSRRPGFNRRTACGPTPRRHWVTSVHRRENWPGHVGSSCTHRADRRPIVCRSTWTRHLPFSHDKNDAGIKFRPSSFYIYDVEEE